MVMKELKFEGNWKTYSKKGRNNTFDDGALITISSSSSKSKNKDPLLKGLRVVQHGYILFHKNLVKQFNSSANQVVILVNKNFLAFKFVNNSQDIYTYKLRSISRFKFQIMSGVSSRVEPRKYFENDVYLDKKNNFPVIKIKFKEGKEITDLDLETKPEEILEPKKEVKVRNYLKDKK